jgi:ferric-dicitrate binding protein FerR (iron transport regulator)
VHLLQGEAYFEVAHNAKRPFLVYAGANIVRAVGTAFTPVTIVISDPAISNVRIGGYFKVGETEALLEALETSFGVRVNRVNDKLVYLAGK